MLEQLKSCLYCNTIIKKEPNRSWTSYNKKKFCSRKCSSKSQSNKQIVCCKHCHKTLLRSPSHIKKNNYCSKKCRHLYNCVTYICPVCNKESTKPKSTIIENQQHIYCSKQCADIGRRVDKPILTCDFCGKNFERYPSEIKKAKERGYRFVFCSHDCRAMMIANEFENKEGYKKKHTSKPRNGTKSIIWRKCVKEKDNYICQDCGKTNILVVAHHIKPYALYPKLRYEVSNGLTLCYPCHEKRHSAQVISE